MSLLNTFFILTFHLLLYSPLLSPLSSNFHSIILSAMIKFRPSTVKKGLLFSCPQPGCHLPNSSWAGIIKLFPARESLVSDTPAGDGKTANLFLQCPFSPLSSYTAGHTLLILSASISSRLDTSFFLTVNFLPFTTINIHLFIFFIFIFTRSHYTTFSSLKKISVGLHPFLPPPLFGFDPSRRKAYIKQD
jgi:hypothetical protein